MICLPKSVLWCVVRHSCRTVSRPVSSLRHSCRSAVQVPNFTAYADACAILLPSAVRALPEWRQDALSPHRMSTVSTVGPLTPISRLFHDDARSEVSRSVNLCCDRTL